MKKFNLISFSLLMAVGALAGCDNGKEHVHTYSDEWSTNDSSHWHAASCEHTDLTNDMAEHEFNDDGTCSVCNYYKESEDKTLVFTNEKLGSFVGEFYAGSSKYVVTKDGISITTGSDTSTLANNKITGTGSDTVATYKDSNGIEYSLAWANAEWDKNNLGLKLPTLTNGDNHVQLQPSIECAQGWYDGWDGDMETKNVLYIVTNEYDAANESFQMYGALFGSGMFTKSYHIKSSFVEVDGSVKLGISWFDATDLSVGHNYQEWNYYFAQDEETGRLNFVTLDEYNEPYWWARSSYLLGEYLKASSTELSLGTIFEDWSYDAYAFDVNQDEKTVSINWGDYLAYTDAYDEHGHYTLIGDMKIRGTSYGISIETAEGVEECPIFFFRNFYSLQSNRYVNGQNSIEFVSDLDWDTWEYDDYLAINGAKADSSSLAIVNNQVYLKGVVGEDTYLVSPYDGTDVVYVQKNDKADLYINDSFALVFENSYFTSSMGTLEVNSDLEVTYGTETYQGYLSYAGSYGVILTFGEDKFILSFDEDGKVFGLIDGEESTYLIPQMVVTSAKGNWKSGKYELSINDSKVTFDGMEFNISGVTSLVSTLGGYIPALVFGSNRVTYYVTLDVDNAQVYKAGTSSKITYIDSFIRPEMFNKFYGEYVYEGKFGAEYVKFTDDNKLFVSIMNETGDGTVLVEVEYTAFIDSNGKPCLEFMYKDVPVDIVFNSVADCSIFTVDFITKVLFENQGLFGETSESYLSVVGKNLYYNDTALTISSIEGNTVNVSAAGETGSVTFSENSVTIALGENEPVTLTKNSISLASFVCDVQSNVGGLGEDVKITEQGIFMHGNFDLPDVWNQITDFRFEIDGDGNVSITFIYKVAYTYTVTIEDGVVVIKGESSLPPLPPPPPML